MVVANTSLAGPSPLSSTPIRERVPRPNPWYDLFKEPLASASGYAPCPGHDWQNTTASYEACGDAAECRGRRLAALDALDDLLQQNAMDRGGKPGDWKVVVLKGWWLKETRVETTVHIDCTYAIVPRDAEV